MLALSLSARAELPLTRVAETGVDNELGPDLGAGVVYTHLAVPVVDASGNVVFHAEFAGPSVTANDDSAIVAGPPTSAQITIREGDPSPVDGLPLLQLQTTPNAGNGNVLATDLFDYVTHSGQSLVSLLRIGAQAADSSQGVLYNSAPRTLASDNGLYAFSASLTGVVTSMNDEAVFFGLPSALTRIARKGEPAPGVGSDTYGDILAVGVAPDGCVAMHALLANGGEGAWVGDDAGLTLFVRDGAAAPGLPSGAIFVAFDQAPAVASGSVVAFKGFTVGPVAGNENEGLWIGQPGALTLFLREGTTPAGLPAGVRIDGHFIDNNTPQINDAGQFTYRARLTGAGVTASNDRAIFAGDPVSPTLVAREGDVAPDTGGAVFESLFEPTINQPGSVAFLSLIKGAGVSGDNDLALFVWTASQGLRLVARDGNTVVFGIGDDRTIVDIDFFGGVRGSSGLATGLGDNGVIAFRAGVLPNGDAIISARVPGSDPADLNGDGVVDGMDLAGFLTFWGPCPVSCAPDFNGDNVVDGMDLALLLASWTN